MHAHASAPQTPERIEIIDGLRSMNNRRKIPSIPNKIIKVFHDSKPDINDYKQYYEQLQSNQINGVGPGNYQLKDVFSINKNKVGTARRAQLQHNTPSIEMPLCS